MSDTHNAATSKAGAEQGFKSDVQQLGQYVGQLHDDLAGIAKGAGEVAQSGVAAVKEGGKTTLQAMKGKSEQATASLRGRVVKHPAATLGIAVGVGILIGMVGSAIVNSKRRVS